MFIVQATGINFFRNKLECLSLPTKSYIWKQCRSLPLEKNPVRSFDWVGSSLAYIRLGQKCFRAANTLAYYNPELITTLKSFIVQSHSPVVNVINLFCPLFTNICTKLERLLE